MIEISYYVGLSNILDSELCRRKPTKRSHRKVVGTTIVDRKLLSEVLKRIEGVTGIEPLLVFAVAAFNLAIMARYANRTLQYHDSGIGQHDWFMEPGALSQRLWT